MWKEGELFDISSNVWQSFSSEQFLKDDVELEKVKLLTLQWFYCHLSSNHVVMLAMDLVVGYQLAADMLNVSVDSVSEEDERDAVVELMNCICGQLDRDHPADECFGLPRVLAREEINVLLSRLNKLSDVTAKVGGEWLYIALFEAGATKNLGVMA
jgi:hypothetical protein